MLPINFTGFSGSNQAVDPRQLAEAVCTSIVDADPTQPGSLRPLKARSTVATVPTVPQQKTIWRMGRDVLNDANYWLSWSTVVHAMLAFGTNSTERTFFTGSGTPKWTDTAIGLGSAPYPQGTRELAVPNPDSAPTLVLNTDGATGTASERFYVETFANDLGWESGPSPVSAALTCKPGAIVDITLTATPPAGNYGFTVRRIYRTQSDVTGTADLYFLREVPIGTTTTSDDARALNDLLPTEGFLPPPSDGFALTPLWNSMVAMLSGKTLYICEPGYPYAYPLRNQKSLRNKPVAMATWGENLLVLTSAAPVHFYGTDPQSITDRPPGIPQACRSALGVVSFSHGVVWPSSEGLAYYGDNGQYLVTLGVVRPEQWRAMNPDTMVAGRWGRFYVCSYDSGGGVLKGFMMDPLRPQDGLWSLSSGFDACHYDDLADALYVLEGGNVRKFAAGAALTATAVSKQFVQPKPVNYGFCKVKATAYPVTVKVYADGVLTDTTAVADSDAFTLSNEFGAEQWQVEVDSANAVQLVRLATDPEHLKGA